MSLLYIVRFCLLELPLLFSILLLLLLLELLDFDNYYLLDFYSSSLSEFIDLELDIMNLLFKSLLCIFKLLILFLFDDMAINLFG